MDTKLKQRLLGAIVLLALIIIFLPMLFSRHAKDKTPTLQEIPSAPAQPTMTQNNTDQLNTASVSAQTNGASTTDQATVQIPVQPSSNMTTTVAPQKNIQTPVVTSTPTPAQSTSEGVAETISAPVPPTKISLPKTVTPEVKVQPVKKETTITPIKTIHQKKPLETKMPMLPKETTDNQVDTQITSNTKSAGAPVRDATSSNNQLKNPTEAAMKQDFHSLNIRESDLTSSNVAGAFPTKAKILNNRKRVEKAIAHNKAYVVQLGYFGNSANAKRLVAKLRAKGFTAYGYQSMHGAKTMTHVFVGPSAKRNQAELMRAKLLKEMKIKGVIVNFDPKELH